MKITVTPLDIVAGARGEPCSCPIALAIRRQIPGSDPLVTPEEVGIEWDDRRVDYPAYDLPQEARDFIGRFDAGLPVDPFEFDLDYEASS